MYRENSLSLSEIDPCTLSDKTINVERNNLSHHLNSTILRMETSHDPSKIALPSPCHRAQSQ